MSSGTSELPQPKPDQPKPDQPKPEPQPPARRILVLAGASGSGKSLVANRLGIPVIRLDDFYRDLDHPGLPRRNGIVDWDDVRTWDRDAALAALTAACHEPDVAVPVYDIPTSRRTGQQALLLGDARLVLAEGIFAGDVVAPLRERGLLGGAFHLQQSRTTTAMRRFARDVGESRKGLGTLVRRGFALWRREPGLVRGWRQRGLEPLPRVGAEDYLLAVIAAAAPS